MVELRVVVSDELAAHLAERARREHTTPEQLASRAVESLLGSSGAPDREEPGFIALGSSGRSDISERAEEILRADFGA
jgi:hypothetical protein